MVHQRVTLITVGAIDLPELRSSIRSWAGARRPLAQTVIACSRLAGVLLSLYPLKDLARDSGIDFTASKDTVSRVNLAINVDKPEEVDQTIVEIAAAGGKIVRQPADAFWGGRVAYFLDPENNLWEVAWNPTAVFDERGAMLAF